MSYLTREQATAKLEATYGSDANAGATLDQAPAYPQCTRTNFYLITRYPAGPVWRDGKVIGQHPDMWTVSSW